MPKIVDHDVRRAAIVDAFLDLVARKGLAAATMRAVAAELKMSMGSIWYYFDSVESLVAIARESVIERTNRRMDARCAGLTGIHRLFVILEDLLPLDDVTKSEDLIFINFWGQSAMNPERQKNASRPQESEWYRKLRESLDEAALAGELRDEAPVGSLGPLLLTIFMGQLLLFVINQDREQQDGRELILDVLRPWLTDSGLQAVPPLIRTATPTPEAMVSTKRSHTRTTRAR